MMANVRSVDISGRSYDRYDWYDSYDGYDRYGGGVTSP
jgi:hypothetical protein